MILLKIFEEPILMDSQKKLGIFTTPSVLHKVVVIANYWLIISAFS